MDAGKLDEFTAFQREIRDPIHRYIKLTKGENEIVDSYYFRRLANISQMHSAHLVYPGAQYPRKVHSLGAMHLAHRVICRLLYQQYPPTYRSNHPLIFIDNPKRRENWECDELDLQQGLETLDDEVEDIDIPSFDREDTGIYIIQMTRLAGLLHDLGHAPYSHLFEEASRLVEDNGEDNENIRFNHEAMGLDLIRGFLTQDHTDFGGPYLDREDAEVICRIISGDLPAEISFLHEIVSAPLDVDKMDYLLRDSYYAGTPEYGTIDIDRILDAVVVVEGKLCYATEALDALINGLNAMFFMYSNVYLHKTTRAFDLAALDGLRGISGVLLGLREEPEAFLRVDEHNLERHLRGVLSDPGADEGVDEEACNRAINALHDLRYRVKKYKVLVDEKVALPVGAVPNKDAYRDEVERIGDEFSGLATDFSTTTDAEIRLDLEKNIRPIGLKVEELGLFFNSTSVYDVQLREGRKFVDYAPHFKTLLRIVVPVRMYCDYQDYEEIRANHDDALIELRREARRKVKEYQLSLLERARG